MIHTEITNLIDYSHKIILTNLLTDTKSENQC